MIAQPEVLHAPGCYGSALAYKAADPQCETCPFVGTCGPRSLERLAALREQYGLKPPKIVPQHKIVTTPAGDVMTLSDRVSDLMKRIERAGVNITGNFAEGRNPFTKTPMFLRVASHLLLKLPEGVTRQGLTAAFVTHLNWSPQTAAPHASLAAKLFIAVGAVDDLDGRLILRRH